MVRRKQTQDQEERSREGLDENGSDAWMHPDIDDTSIDDAIRARLAKERALVSNVITTPLHESGDRSGLSMADVTAQLSILVGDLKQAGYRLKLRGRVRQGEQCSQRAYELHQLIGRLHEYTLIRDAKQR